MMSAVTSASHLQVKRIHKTQLDLAAWKAFALTPAESRCERENITMSSDQLSLPSTVRSLLAHASIHDAAL